MIPEEQEDLLKEIEELKQAQYLNLIARKDLEGTVASQQEEINELRKVVATSEEILKTLKSLTTICANTQKQVAEINRNTPGQPW